MMFVKTIGKSIINFHNVRAEFICFPQPIYFLPSAFETNSFSGSCAMFQHGRGNGIRDECRNVNSIKQGEWKLNYNGG